MSRRKGACFCDYLGVDGPGGSLEDEGLVLVIAWGWTDQVEV